MSTSHLGFILVFEENAHSLTAHIDNITNCRFCKTLSAWENTHCQLKCKYFICISLHVGKVKVRVSAVYNTQQFKIPKGNYCGGSLNDHIHIVHFYQRSCGKVMFSVMSMRHSFHGGGLCDNYP